MPATMVMGSVKWCMNAALAAPQKNLIAASRKILSKHTQIDTQVDIAHN